jgi:hypothetical protein
MKKERMMVDKKKYIERLLGNERLTRDLDDESAQILINWGIAMVERGDIRDERALRQVERVMRRAGSFVGRLGDQSFDENREAFDAVVSELAQIEEFRKIAVGEDKVRAYISRTQLQSPKQRLQILMNLLTDAVEEQVEPRGMRSGRRIAQRGRAITPARDRDGEDASATHRMKRAQSEGDGNTFSAKKRSGASRSRRERGDGSEQSEQRISQRETDADTQEQSGASFSTRTRGPEKTASQAPLRRKGQTLGPASDDPYGDRKSRKMKKHEDEENGDTMEKMR